MSFSLCAPSPPLFFHPVSCCLFFLSPLSLLFSLFNAHSVCLLLLQLQSIPLLCRSTRSFSFWTLYPSIKLTVCLLFAHSSPFVFSSPSLFSFSSPLPLCLRWESVFCDVVGARFLRLDPANVWHPEAPEVGEHLAAEWVGGRESYRNPTGLD